MSINVTRETLQEAKDAVRRFLDAYEPTPSAHITKRSLRCLEKAVNSQDCETFKRYIQALGMEEGILAKVFGLEFEF